MAPGLAAVVALLPFARGLALGRAFYFRDLARNFFPLRRFYTAGLQDGQLRLWNPFVQEGISDQPLHFYPFDLLQLLLDDESGFSLLLALHVGLAAAAMAALVQSLGGRRTAAVSGGVVYALGGYGLSLLNLDMALRGYAWAPLMVLSMRAAAAGSWRHVGVAALVFGLALTTLSPEVQAQAILLSVLLSTPSLERSRLARIVSILVLALGLASLPLMLQARLIPGSARAALLPLEDSLTDSVPTLAWLQVLVANLFGDLARIGTDWWAVEHFRRGFPYIISLYLGPTAVALLATGAWTAPWLRRRLLVALGLAIVVCMGEAGGLVPLVLEVVPSARAFRYPVKAFFTVQFAVALLVAGGVQTLLVRLASWRSFAAWALALGSALCSGRLLWTASQALALDWMGGLFPDPMGPAERAARLEQILTDAALGGALALAAGLIGASVAAGRMRSRTGAVLVCAVLASDLLRAGAGVNPMVTQDYYTLSEPAQRLWDDVAAGQGRVFTCDIVAQPGYRAARRVAHDRSDSYLFAALLESATPHGNVALGLPTALSADLTSLSPVERTSPPEDLYCENIDRLAPRLRLAGVTHVVSADVLASAELSLLNVLRPPRLAPLALYVYRLRAPLPRYEVAARVAAADSREASEAAALADPGTSRVEADGVGPGALGKILAASSDTQSFRIQAEANGPTLLVIREGWGPGWRARLDERPTPVLRANGRHLAVAIPAGRSRVVLEHHPWELDAGLAVTLASALCLGALLVGGRGRAPTG